ncbi:hypothetical protein nbrc107696_38830 [Gordonia spumicola]|uniref:SGNH hydrolase-type esterase domain-containing protein n=1 Tax=Gordonia spumicola TaxID=589161 RepID=A0A7I9VDQ3_9ACTN|nr:SGNH/GDSL hydrolase family protein [Gordonia spumicola]GEE03437.1 hypothetical protein nbrc107696_38830 [Gordonia spumicola]
MTTQKKLPVRATTMRRRVRLTAGVVGALAALSAAFVAPASAAPVTPTVPEPSIGDLIDSAGRILQELPIDQNGSGGYDLQSIFNLLVPQSPDQKTPQQQAVPTGDRRTSCTQVTQIGDSTSVGIDSASKVTDPADRLTAQFTRVGATDVVLDASGGRSIVEKVDGEPNAVDAVTAQLASGRRGCWVIAMGVNDAANIAVGSTVDADARIDRIMSKLTGLDVLWPTVMTSNPSNKAYAPDNMRKFNAALQRATTRYPNLKVYDFASETQDSWYVDGIHYNATGIVQRNRLFATALATAFPS